MGADALGLVAAKVPKNLKADGGLIFEEGSKFFRIKDDDTGFFFADGTFSGATLIKEIRFTEVIAGACGGEPGSSAIEADASGKNHDEAEGRTAFGLDHFVADKEAELPDRKKAHGFGDIEISKEGTPGKDIGAEIELGGGHRSGGVFDFDDDSGDIVLATASIGTGDEARDDLLTVGLAKDGDDLVFDEIIGEAVGAEEKLITALEFVPLDIGEDFGAVADGLKEGIAVGDVLGVFGANDPFFDLLDEKGLVFGDLNDFFAADAVDPAISDVADDSLFGADEEENREGGSHIFASAFLDGEVVDFGIGGFDGANDDLLDPLTALGAWIEVVGLDAAHGVVDVVSDGFDSALAGEFTVFVAPHAVSDDKQAIDGIRKEVVFVVFADTTDVAFDPSLQHDLGGLGFFCPRFRVWLAWHRRSNRSVRDCRWRKA